MAAEPKKDDMAQTNLILLGVFCCFLAFMWYTNHATISYYCLKFAWFVLGALDWSWSPEIIRSWRLQIAQLAAQSGQLKFDQLLTVMNRAGYFFVWIPVILAIKGIKTAIEKHKKQPKRKITIQTLPWLMAKHAPAVIPSLYYGNPNDLLLNVDPPEHRGALNPEEWVTQHHLLINSQLDRDLCRTLLVKQLGTKLTSIDDLNSHERALFAVFAARLFGTHKDHGSAQKLLDELNYSCHKGTWNGQKGYPILTIADDQFAKFSKSPAVREWLAKHAYSRTLLHAMHKEALKSGKLPSSHFRWLKAMDRGLWYALNTTGRKTPFVESAAVFCHTMWEEYAADLNYQLTEPYVDQAIDGVEAYLRKIGIIFN